jgi:tetratricopeptide (TPR) repeat protein
MKKWILLVLLLVLFGAGGAYYFEIGVSPQVKRERYLAKAKAFAEGAKINEAVIEYKNALKVDPAHAETHYEFGLLLLKKGDFRAAAYSIELLGRAARDSPSRGRALARFVGGLADPSCWSFAAVHQLRRSFNVPRTSAGDVSGGVTATLAERAAPEVENTTSTQ